MHSELFIRAGKEIVFNESDWDRVWAILKKIEDREQGHKDEIEIKNSPDYFGLYRKRHQKYCSLWEKKQLE